MLSLLLLVAAQASAATPADPAAAAKPLNKQETAFLKKLYPPRAKKAGEQGNVGFRITVERDGAVSACELTQSSGYKSLDAETCDLLVRYARVKPAQDSEGHAIRASRDGQMKWVLPGRAAPPPNRAVGAGASLDMDKIICKRSVTTGSLASTTKQCMTRREWSRAADQARETIDSMGMGRGYYEDGDGGAATLANPAGPGN